MIYTAHIADEIERRIISEIDGTEVRNNEYDLVLYQHGAKLATIDLSQLHVELPSSEAASVKVAKRSARKKADQIAKEVCEEFGAPSEEVR